MLVMPWGTFALGTAARAAELARVGTLVAPSAWDKAVGIAATTIVGIASAGAVNAAVRAAVPPDHPATVAQEDHNFHQAFYGPRRTPPGSIGGPYRRHGRPYRRNRWGNMIDRGILHPMPGPTYRPGEVYMGLPGKYYRT
jgi:hypothetical protein